MSSFYATINSFNAGELSPKMLARTDVAQYGKGCRTLRNFLVTPYGAAERRPGTRYIADAKISGANTSVRLIRFVVSASVAYVCEFGNKYIRFYRNGARVQSGGSPVEILETPYTAAELSGLQFVQSADVMTLVHPNHPPMELRRTAADAFELAVKTYEYPPMLDPNLDDDLTIAVTSGTINLIGGTVGLTASGDIFNSDNVDGYFQLQHVRDENEINIDYKKNNGTLVPVVIDGGTVYESSASALAQTLEVYGYWTFTTHGTWTGHVTLQRSFDNGSTWSDYRTFSSSKDSNVSTSGEEEGDNVLYRVKMSDYEQSDSGTLKMCRCSFVNPDFIRTGVVKIIEVSGGTAASAEVVKILGGTAATAEWNEGAWSVRRGYPRAVAFYEERLLMAGTKDHPQRVWGSKTGAWDNFLLGDKDDAGLDFTLASDTVNAIRWMCQHDALVIGTEDSEWTLSASSSDAALTPSNFRVKRQSVYGTAEIAAQMVGDTILFVQRGSRKVREFVYSWEKDGYSSPDLTILADHITASGIVETQLQQLPDSILWCVLADGTLAALTYERDQEVVGWHKHTTLGKVKSICVIPDGDTDAVYLAVDRVRGSGTHQTTIEIMAPREWSDIAHTCFADCAKVVTVSGGTSSVSGLTHLEGHTVKVLTDGKPHHDRVVTGGTISLDETAKVIVVGLPYESMLSPMPIELDAQNGQTMTRRKILGELRLRVYDTVGGEARVGAGQWQLVVSRDVEADNLDLAVTPKSEVVTLIPLGGYQRETIIEVRQDAPLPFNISMMATTYEVTE